MAAAGALACALQLTGCGGPFAGGTAAGADTSYVGVAVGLRTPERYADVFVGVQLALDTLNATRPAGAPILALRRAPAGAKSAVDVAAAFRDDPAVIGVVGHTESDATIDAGPVYADQANDGRRALVAISPTASGTLVTRGNDWIFRVCPVGTASALVLARFAADSLHLQRVTVVYRNDAMGKDFRGIFLDEFGNKDGQVVEADPFMEEISEFDAYALRSARRGAQALVVAGNAPDALRARRASRAAGGSTVMLTTNPPPATPAPGEAPDYAGMYYLTLFTADQPPTEAGARFVTTFQQEFHRAPDHWSALAYDAAMLIGRAAQARGANRRAIRDWIAGVGHGQPAYVGVTGRIAFDDEGDPVDKQLLVRSARF